MKIGRNSNCPCGSGKKFKHCCLSGKAAGHQPTPESQEFLDAIKAQANTQPFSSIDEMQAFANQRMEAQNNRALDEFEGLSPKQMGAVLGQLPGRDKVCQFATGLEAPSAPIMKLFELLIIAIGDKGLKATATGNLPRQFCRDAAKSLLGEEGYEARTRYGGINTEPDYQEVHLMRISSELAGLIKTERGRFITTAKGKKLLKAQSFTAAYLPLLKAFTEEFNWSYADRYPELPFIGQSWMFSLWLLHRHGGEFHKLDYYQDKYIKAFPILLEQAAHSSDPISSDTIKQVYSLRTFHRFLDFFGLVECRKTDPDDFFSESSVKTTQLFSDLITFSV